MDTPSLGTIKTAFSTLTDLVKKGMTVEAREKIMDLREMLLELRESNIELQEEIKSLKEEQLIVSELSYKNNVYWINGDKEKDGPFCPPCWDDKKKLIRMQDDGYVYQCKVCGNAEQYGEYPLHGQTHY